LLKKNKHLGFKKTEDYLFFGWERLKQQRGRREEQLS